MSDVLEATNAGWRPDPSGRYEWRYWNGGWTNRVANTARPAGETTPVVPTPVVPTSTAPPQAITPAPTPAVPPAPTPAVPPAPTPAVAPPSAPAASRVPTIPLQHDGSSGTPWDAPYVPPYERERGPTEPLSFLGRLVAAVAGWFRGFWEQPESYHSPNAGVELPPHPKEAELARPANYGRAGLVMFSAFAIAVGAYLPWISGTINGIAFERTGYQQGRAWGFTWAAAAFAIAALLGVRHKVMGWVTMGMAAVVAALVARQLVDTHDQVVSMNVAPAVNADVGIGLWIMLVAAAIGLIAAFRLDRSEEIV